MKNSDPDLQDSAVPLAHRQSPRKGVVVLAGVVVVVLVALGCWLWQGRAALPLAKSVVRAQRRAPPAPSAPGDTPTIASPALREPAPTEPTKGIDVCGLGYFGPDEDENSIRSAHAPAIAAAKAANIQALLDSPNPSARAAGLVFQIAEISERFSIERFKATDTCKVQNEKGGAESAKDLCASAAVKVENLELQRDRAAEPWIGKLANLAAASSDPAILAQAVRACVGRNGLPACQAVSAEQWARLEPNNLLPWSYLLAQARARNDFAGVNEALYRMSIAKTATSYELFAWSQLGEGGLNAVSDIQRLVATGQTVSLFLLPLTDFDATLSECRVPLVNDANRRQLCEKIATALVEQSDTYFAAAMGTAVGRSAGWPVSKLAPVIARRTVEAEFAAETSNETLTPDGLQKLDCQSVASTLNFRRSIGRLGESSAVRESGKAKNIDFAARAKLRLPVDLQRLEQDAARAQQKPRALP